MKKLRLKKLTSIKKEKLIIYKVSNKNTIIKKASDLFLKNGITVISMADLAAECSISKKTIFHHFLNKEDLVNEINNF